MAVDQSEVAYVNAELKELIPRFFKSLQSDIETLQQAVKVGNIPEIQRVGHNIKGAGQGYGFEALGILGQRIEEAAVADEWAFRG